MPRNIELIIAYDGGNFKGWQIQPQVRTAQGVLNAKLAVLLGEKVVTLGTSRTDSGVHAHDQHVSFVMNSSIPMDSLERALNHHLPDDLRLLSAKEWKKPFSARHNACGKHYLFLISQGRHINPFLGRYALHVERELDVPSMNRAASLFEGIHEFTSLQSVHDSRDSARVCIHKACLEKRGDLILFHVIGHSFLYNMIRNMVGSLLRVGQKDWSVETFLENLISGDRKRMGMTVPGHGLHLIKVFFKDEVFSLKPGMRTFSQHFCGFSNCSEFDGHT